MAAKKMKILVLIGDGMADHPIDRLGNRTPLEAVETPNMDELARTGAVGITRNVPDGMEPHSDVAIMSIMGYDPAECYNGRGPLEAASIGVDIKPGETAFRCNLITIDGDIISDYSGGHIETKDSGELIRDLKANLDGDSVSFHHGVSFRNLLVVRGDFSGIVTPAPHDHLNEPWEKYLPSGPGQEQLRDLFSRARKILENHPMNERRKREGHAPANAIWPWSGGGRPKMDTYLDKFGLTGNVISAVDLVQGLGVLAGLTPIKVPGATGMVDTNYEGKVAAAIEAMEKVDFVLVHIEGIDEAAHMADLELKMEGIRRFDKLVVGPLAERLRRFEEYLLLILPDHPTPVELRTHTNKPVPFIALSPSLQKVPSVSGFSEHIAESTGIFEKHGHNLLATLLARRLPQ
jgi:2,3-bisphosphoglycerate-independent phosphoglycerate mutase